VGKNVFSGQESFLVRLVPPFIGERRGVLSCSWVHPGPLLAGLGSHWYAMPGPLRFVRG
jgi:hypothetical protein